ncbi:hypothetical protein BIZ46_00450 [Helicobacter pylori]|nr:hypothetical protein BIZ46_00450 [Helicobacter pylori]
MSLSFSFFSSAFALVRLSFSVVRVSFFSVSSAFSVVRVLFLSVSSAFWLSSLSLSLARLFFSLFSLLISSWTPLSASSFF